MLKGQRQNFHRSKLPNSGDVGHIVGLSTIDPRRRCLVSHFPLCDNDWLYSHGIHTIFVRFLDDSTFTRVSGHWFQAEA